MSLCQRRFVYLLMVLGVFFFASWPHKTFRNVLASEMFRVLNWYFSIHACFAGKEDGKFCKKVTVRMTIRKNDCRSNTPVSKQLSQFLLIDRKKIRKRKKEGKNSTVVLSASLFLPEMEVSVLHRTV